MDNSVRNLRSDHGEEGGSSNSWWPSSWSGHGSEGLNASIHSNKSSGSNHGGITELTTRNSLHSRWTRGSGRIVEEREIRDDDCDSDESDSEEEIQLRMAPADRDYERGTWLRTMVNS